MATGARIETLARRLSTAPDRSCRISSRLLRFPCHRERFSQSRSGAYGTGGLDEVGTDGAENRVRRDIHQGHQSREIRSLEEHEFRREFRGIAARREERLPQGTLGQRGQVQFARSVSSFSKRLS